MAAPDPARLRDFIERHLPVEEGHGMDIIAHVEA